MSTSSSRPTPAATPVAASAERHRHQALLKTDALQNAILNCANFFSIATDEGGVIQLFNVGAERMLGYAASEMLDQATAAELSAPGELAARALVLSAEFGVPVMPPFDAMVFKASRGVEDIHEMTYLRKDGSHFPAIVSVTALRGPDELIIGYLLLGSDNTVRKQIEVEQRKLDQQLREQQFYTRSLIESNIDALMATDPSGIISDVNKQMEALTGWSRDELIGAPLKDYFTDPDRVEAGMNLVLAGNRLTDYELTVQSRDGRETMVSYNATLFHDRDRRLKGVFASARDVTERNRLDRALSDTTTALERAKSAAEKANQAKSDFLSSMSHELRSPLNAILGFAQLMEAGPPPPTPGQVSSINQILQAGWYLLELINEILDLSLIESGKLSLSRESLSLADLLQDCQAMTDSQARSHGIVVSCVPFDALVHVNADRTRLKQVVINLLTNAIKYNRPGGSVEISCRGMANGRIRICVEDTGEGLSPENLAQLFQPFNRLGQESGATEGTGIGLVVSKRLVDLMDGAIGATSTVGVGSVFWIELRTAGQPRLATMAATAPQAACEPVGTDTRVRTVLCIEDNPANLLLIKELIALRPNLRMLSATDGVEGVEIACAEQPDVILMDINLPRLGGFDALQLLAGNLATAHIPTIALSANAMPSDIARGLAAGFFRYMTKPIRIDEFWESIDAALKLADTDGPVE